jgi:acyl-CoA thioester hydrolase
MADPWKTTRRVEFRDTDAAGIVHFSAFFPMMEAAEHEFLRGLGIAILPPPEIEPRITWPRINATCDYHRAARFEDILTIAVAVEHLGNSSVRYRFEFSNENESSEKQSVATGHITAVCCELTDDGLKKTVIPDTLRSLLQRALAV